MRPPARRAQELARTFAGRPEQDTRAVVRLKTFCAAISTAPPNLPGMPMSHLLSRELWRDARHYQIAALLCFFAILVLAAARRSDVAIFFLASHAALLFARAAWLGDPLAIPIHQLQSGSLLIFAFFMISDPRTTPDSRLGRFIFALSVALLAHYMTFFMQMRPALYVALIVLSPLILLIDKILPAERFRWTRPAIQ